MTWLRRLLCRHDWMWIRNLYGDEIIMCGWKRSFWGCRKCGKLQYREELVSDDVL